jgi:RNA polymerase sigma-70 factor (ECF subfamily)
MGAIPAIRSDAGVTASVPSVEELVRRAQNGDARSFERLYRQLVGRVYGLCLRMSGDVQMAEELTQDVFVRAWEKLDTFRGDSQFPTWLHRLAVNVVLQARRSMARRRSHEEISPDPGHYLKSVQRAMPGTKMDLEKAIASLPPGARQVLILRDIEGYKYREVARLTGVTLGTVKAQIHRARRMVREALER